MTIYRTFQEAIRVWREQGGALNYCGNYSDPERWEVIDIGTAEDYTIGTNGGDFETPREMTEHALTMGGLTPEQIESEMADWVDDPAWGTTTYREILHEAFEHCQVLTLDHTVPVWFSDGAGESVRCESLAEVEELAALGDYGGPAADYRIMYDYSPNSAPEYYHCTIEARRGGEWSMVFEVSNRQD